MIMNRKKTGPPSKVSIKGTWGTLTWVGEDGIFTPEEGKIIDSDESITSATSATVLEDGWLIIDESKTNATNTREENTEVTDVANTTEVVNKKTANDANKAKAVHEITSTSENANDKRLQPKQPTQVHQSQQKTIRQLQKSQNRSK